jgi:hypothetical protein
MNNGCIEGGWMWYLMDGCGSGWTDEWLCGNVGLAG